MAVVEGVFTATGVSGNITPELGDHRQSGQFNIFLSGMGAGDLVVLERSFDGGSSFAQVKEYDAIDANEIGAEPEVGVKYRFNCTALASGGGTGPLPFRLSY